MSNRKHGNGPRLFNAPVESLVKLVLVVQVAIDSIVIRQVRLLRLVDLLLMGLLCMLLVARRLLLLLTVAVVSNMLGHSIIIIAILLLLRLLGNGCR